MPADRHTWLLEPGVWAASGRFWQDGEVEGEGHGRSIVRHGERVWEIEGPMTILGEPPAEFRNTYEVPIPRAGARTIPWRSHNPAIGPLEGVFFVADDAIMSSIQASDGGFAGSEHMTRLAPDRYEARGLLLRGGSCSPPGR